MRYVPKILLTVKTASQSFTAMFRENMSIDEIMSSLNIKGQPTYKSRLVSFRTTIRDLGLKHDDVLEVT